MKTITMQYTETGPDFCRVNFKTTNAADQTIHYCLMEEGSGVGLYRTSGGDFDEPQYSVKPRPGVEVEFETPPDEYGQWLVRRYLESMNN